MNLYGFTRSEYTTPGSDPTTVVTWTWREPVGSIEIREFQNIIQTYLYGKMSKTLALQIIGSALHTSLCELATQTDLRDADEECLKDYE